MHKMQTIAKRGEYVGEETRGKVFDILKYAVHDGPGIRNTVFLKGCPLSCWWCHNPESQSIEKQVLVYPNKCIMCDECFKVCKVNALKRIDGKMSIDRKLCVRCGDCADVCFPEALVLDTDIMTVKEVIEEVIKDEDFYERSKGGVTVSGGEPFVQFDFLIELLKGLKSKSLHTVVDTSGYTKIENLLEASKYTDLFLYDFKMLNNQKHKEYIGVDNSIILENLKELLKNGSKVYLRIPVIPNVNLNDIELNNMKDFILDLPNKENILQINLLPYHKLGEAKYERLNEGYKMDGFDEPSNEDMQKAKMIMEKTGLLVKIGG